MKIYGNEKCNESNLENCAAINVNLSEVHLQTSIRVILVVGLLRNCVICFITKPTAASLCSRLKMMNIQVTQQFACVCDAQPLTVELELPFKMFLTHSKTVPRDFLN